VLLPPFPWLEPAAAAAAAAAAAPAMFWCDDVVIGGRIDNMIDECMSFMLYGRTNGMCRGRRATWVYIDVGN
jgi:hypothetical protein